MLPGGEQLRVGVVESQLGHGEADEAQAHEDGAAPIRDEQCGRWTNQGSPDHADDEGEVVSAADALVEPLAVMVEDVYTFVTDRAVLGPDGGDVDLTQVTPRRTLSNQRQSQCGLLTSRSLSRVGTWTCPAEGRACWSRGPAGRGLRGR